MGLLYSADIDSLLAINAVYNVIKKLFYWFNRLSNLRIMLIDQIEQAKCANGPYEATHLGIREEEHGVI